MMALLSANMGFLLLLRILEIRQRRRWALRSRAVGREAGRGEAGRSVLARRLLCNRFTDGSRRHLRGSLSRQFALKGDKARERAEIWRRRGAHPIDNSQGMSASFTLATVSPSG